MRKIFNAFMLYAADTHTTYIHQHTHTNTHIHTTHTYKLSVLYTMQKCFDTYIIRSSIHGAKHTRTSARPFSSQYCIIDCLASGLHAIRFHTLIIIIIMRLFVCLRNAWQLHSNSMRLLLHTIHKQIFRSFFYTYNNRLDGFR